MQATLSQCFIAGGRYQLNKIVEFKNFNDFQLSFCSSYVSLMGDHESIFVSSDEEEQTGAQRLIFICSVIPFKH